MNNSRFPRALLLDPLREIKRSFGRFLSIFLIIALGCGFFTGLKATEPDMKETAADYFTSSELMDLRLRSTVGVRSQDIAAVRSAKWVKGACAGYTKDLYYNYDNRNIVVRAFSINSNVKADSENDLNRLVLTEGRMPQAKNECVVENKLSSPETFKVGESITLSAPSEDENISDSLAYDTYEIVGIVISPLYVGFQRDASNVGSGSVNSNIYLPEEDFLLDHYTDIYVSLDIEDGLDPFSDEYKNAVEDKSEPAQKAFEQSVNERCEQLKNDAQKKIDSAQSSIELSEQVLSADSSSLAQLLDEADKGQSAVQAQLDQLGENGGARAYMLRAQLLQIQKKAQLIGQLINDTDGTARAELTEQLQTAKAELEQSKEQLEQFGQPKILSETRFASNDYISYGDDADKINNVSKAFPLFFVLIAALVCVTAMTRMVEEQRTLIGAYKALGYTARHILFKYLFYALTAAIGGSCIGSIIGLQVFPLLIINTYRIMYNIPGAQTPFRADYMLAAAAASAILTSAAVIFTCVGELKDQPAEIMRPKPPAAGKRVLPERIPFIWNRLSFLMKVTVRNLLRYKKRFFMTLVGISGCTALIITGFGLKYSVSSIVDKQYGEIFTFSANAALNTSADSPEKALEEVKGIESYVCAVSKSVDAGSKDMKYNTTIISPDGSLDGFIDMRTVSGKKLALDDSGAVVTQKLAQLCGLEKGDDIIIKDADGEEYSVRISGVMKNFALNYIYMTPAVYEDIFGEKGTPSAAYFNTDGSVKDEDIKTALTSDERILGTAFIADSTEGFVNSIKSLDAIVLMLIVCAAFLALTVLFNLASINITERRREIATIKVLGFYDGETGAYLYRENVISAVIGILIGLELGKVLHRFVIMTVEVEAVLFNRELVWWAYLLGAALTLVFAALVNFALYFRLKKINMVESLKSVE